MPGPTLLAPGVWRIPTVGANLVNSFAFAEPDGSLTLVDTGLRGLGPRRVAAALQSLGKRPEQVSRILLTHAHPDHAGGAARVQRSTGGRIAIHSDEAHSLREGRTPHLDRNLLAGRLLDRWRPRLQVCEVSNTLHDGDVLDVAGGLRVLHTPGHSPGHCSFLHESSGVLITGDALFNFLDRMSWSYAWFCSDVALSRQTAERLGDADYEVAAFTHGAEIRDRARERIRDFLLRKGNQKTAPGR
jgi:glyoxylase-like metal-dependent hydrolase (beta-lactamase superfamily II)